MQGMQAISTLAVLPTGGETQISQASWKRTLTSSEEQQIVRLQAWMTSSFPGQTVGDLAKCWTADWSEIVQRYGADVLTECLRRHRKVSSFLPTRHDVEVQLDVIVAERRAAVEQDQTRKMLAEQDAWKAQCKAEGTAQVHPEAVIGNIASEMQQMRDLCVQVFGQKWRERGGLSEVYEEAQAAIGKGQVAA